jgi:hypothetical protein
MAVCCAVHCLSAREPAWDPTALVTDTVVMAAVADLAKYFQINVLNVFTAQ